MIWLVIVLALLWVSAMFWAVYAYDCGTLNERDRIKALYPNLEGLDPWNSHSH